MYELCIEVQNYLAKHGGQVKVCLIDFIILELVLYTWYDVEIVSFLIILLKGKG